MNTESSIEYVRANKDSILRNLQELVAMPSISTLSEHAPDIERAANWLRQHMESIGLENARLLPTAGHPVVYADYLHAGSEKLTVLVYGHYDVQPVDPIDEWVTPPFEPAIRGDELFARGASDMKSQVIALLTGLAALNRHGGGIPVNVKVLLEGEEEIGSPNLAAFIQDNQELLAADFSLNPDAGMLGPQLPSLVYGLRGIAYFELWVHGAEADLHSGVFGGAVANPAHVMAELIAGMHDAEGRIMLPGYYDRVRSLDDAERALLTKFPLSDEQIREMAGNVPQLYGESGYSTPERVGVRPTLDVNGMYAGFIGKGSKTVLPAKAMAKISMRLVPHQDPGEVREQLRTYLNENAPPTVNWELSNLASARPVLVDRDSSTLKSAHAALQSVFGVEPIYRLEGGSVPVVSMMQDILGIDSVLMGFALPNDSVHAPNEHMHLPTFYNGIEAHIRFLTNLAAA